MSITSLLIVIAITLLISIARSSWRSWLLVIASILAIYWLQPSTPIRHLDFWLPTLTIFLAILVWVVTVPKENIDFRVNFITAIIIASLILLIGLNRYFEPICCLTPTQPPLLLHIAISLIFIGILALLAFVLSGRLKISIYVLSIIIVILLILLKSEPLAKFVSIALRSFNGQTAELATGVDIRWLGFSYVAFRLLHTMIDRLNGRLPILSLQDYVIYIIFYPSFSAGPIDRVQHFTQNLHQPFQQSLENILRGGKRILIGIFRKFVLADTLALFALNNSNSSQVFSTGWLWIIVYAYAFRIYFDFSGYTDIAIGIGSLVGIQLPENFQKPYLKQNLTLFWNSWHMTLANWFRAYFFNPLVRAFRSQPKSLPLALIILIGQLSTFVLIGLWHGISWNFAIWGAWHGLGLFIHNRWTEILKNKSAYFEDKPKFIALVHTAGVIVTFNYVSLGWVWFALNTPDQSWNTFMKLFGLI